MKIRIVKPKVILKTDDTNPLNLDPFMLDTARAFHYGKALAWLDQLGGVKQVGIEHDWTLVIHTIHGTVVKIPPLVMVTRDRNYAMKHIRKVIEGEDLGEVTFNVDMYDREFHGLVETWKE